MIVFIIKDHSVVLSDPILLHLMDHDLYALVGDHNLSVSFDACIRGNAKFEWTLNGADLTNDVVIDHNGVGITIPEVQAYHFGLYMLTAINVNNERKKTRTFRISNKAGPTKGIDKANPYSNKKMGHLPQNIFNRLRKKWEDYIFLGQL